MLRVAVTKFRIELQFYETHLKCKTFISNYFVPDAAIVKSEWKTQLTATLTGNITAIGSTSFQSRIGWVEKVTLVSVSAQCIANWIFENSPHNNLLFKNLTFALFCLCKYSYFSEKFTITKIYKGKRFVKVIVNNAILHL